MSQNYEVILGEQYWTFDDNDMLKSKFLYFLWGLNIMKTIRLECLKFILQGYIILHTWNDEKEDFDILCESTVDDFEKDIPKEFWQREIYEMNPGIVDEDACIIIDLGKGKELSK